jgi:hypothetical protein
MNDYFSPSKSERRLFHHPRHRLGSPPTTAQTLTDSMNRTGNDLGIGRAIVDSVLEPPARGELSRRHRAHSET